MQKNMMENGNREKDMEEVYSQIKMVINVIVNGEMIKNMVEDYSHM